METDYQTIKKSFDFHNKSESNKIVLNTTNEEEKNIELTSNTSSLNTHTSSCSLPNNKETTKSSNSPKMGSRRIFTPQFKLQVLESYRNDSDCKGNQRATARKYNIHRRQIQKWLQCESTLRSSVANINQNSVKHQFHNVSLQQQTKNITNTSHSSISSSSYTSNQLHSAHLCIESSSGTVLSNTIKMPSISTCITTPTTTKTHERFENSNLSTAVAAVPGTVINMNSPCASPGTVSSTLRPATIISANAHATISPLIQHHYTISPFNNIYPQPHPPTSSYQYHNMGYSSTFSHHQIEKHQSSYFTPISLSDLSVSTSNTNCYLPNTEILKLYPKLPSEKNVLLCNDNLIHINYECSDSGAAMNPSSVNGAFNISQFKGDTTYSSNYPFAPMDLSIRHRREVEPALVATIKTNSQNMQQYEIPMRKERSDKTDIVDLTNRKRRVDNANNSCDYIDKFSEKYQKLSELDKMSYKSIVFNSKNITDNNVAAASTSNTNEDDDIEIEVGMEEKFPPSSKPIKLFKPYLLDECKNKNSSVYCNINNSENKQNNQAAQISCFSNSTSTKTDISSDGFARDDTFPAAMKKNNNINTCVESSNFHVESGNESPRSACSSATSVPTMSPTNFQYHKGSPASSGYESSTSTYSDSSLSPRNETFTYGQTYSVKLQMQSICRENINVIDSSKHVQRWLEKDDSKLLTHNSSIALLV